MDKNSWLGLVLIVGIMITWGYFTKPTEEELARQKVVRDSVENVRVDEKIKQLQLEVQTQQPISIGADVVKSDEIINSDMQQLYGDFSTAAIGEREFTTIENNNFIIKFLNQGGRIYSVELKDYKTWTGEPLVLFTGDSTEFGLNFFSQNRRKRTPCPLLSRLIKSLSWIDCKESLW